MISEAGKRILVVLLVASVAWSGENVEGGVRTNAGLEAAHFVYQEEYASTPEGVHLDEGILFVIVEIPPGKGTRNARLARAMLRSKELLQEYTAEHLLDESKRPAPCLLKASFPQSVAFGRESIPDLGFPSFDLRVDVRVLEDGEKEERGYRYTIALRLADLGNNVPIGLYGEPSQEEIISALKKTWTARKKNETLGEFCKSFQLIEDLARYDFSESSSNAPFPKGVPARSPDTVSPVSIARERSGHADFSVMNAFLPQEYHTAEQLYGWGADLPRIITLSFRSAELAPANASPWQLLGQALFTDGQAEAAIPFLAQSLWLDPGNADTRASLAMAYLVCGQRNLAKGMAASVFFACPETSEWSVGKATEILEKCLK